MITREMTVENGVPYRHVTNLESTPEWGTERFRYKVRFLPKNVVSDGCVDVAGESYRDATNRFNALLAKWNSQQPDRWHYYTT